MANTLHLVTSDPSIYILSLPDGCTPGKFAAAKEFAANIKELRRKNPESSFQYLDFERDNYGSLVSIMAIEN